MSLKYSYLVIFIFLHIISCSQGGDFSVFKEKRYRYKFNYPSNMLLLKSSKLTKNEESFLDKLRSEDCIIIYEGVDVALYDRYSYPPVYDVVSVSTIPKYINIKNIEKEKKEIESLFLMQLENKFSDVHILRSEYQNYKIGQTYRLDFIFYYKSIKCFSSTIILTSNVFYSNIVTSISRYDRKNIILEKRDKIVDSFKKY